MTPTRRYDIDWLRIALVLLLVPYHTLRVFNWGESFYAKNPTTSAQLDRFFTFVGPWYMALLFLLAGASSWYALEFRSSGRYAGERLRRLGVPFVFGLVCMIPIQGYVAMLTWYGHVRTWWEQYAYFWTHTNPDLTGYDATWTPAHLWFILFLIVVSLLALPGMLSLRRWGRGLLAACGRACRVPGVILLPALLLVLVQPIDFMDVSGQNIVGYLIVFLVGFVLVSDERFTRTIERDWIWLLALGVAAMTLRTWAEPIHGEPWTHSAALGRFTGRWAYEVGALAMMIGLMGLFRRFCDRTNGLYAYATEGAYPFYILHQTVIVAIAYFVVQWDLPMWLKIVEIVASSYAVTLFVYDVGVRRWDPVRFLFGMKPRRRPVRQQAAATSPRE